MKAKAFSLLEILLTLSILTAISGLMSPIYFSMKNRQDFNNEVDIIISSIRRSQILALSGEHDSSWGLKLENEKLIIFSGNNFASRDIGLDDEVLLNKKITKTGLDEIVFNKISGTTSNFGDVFLDSSGRLKIININSKGIINY